MAIRKREGNRPDRRIAPNDFLDTNQRDFLAARIRYVGSATHKLHPGNYGFIPPQNPRPSKSPCDELRPLLLQEAKTLFEAGIRLGMFSEHQEGGVPKYVWSVDDAGEVYESKTRPERETHYHGYRVGDDDAGMQDYIRREWKRRCQ